jgi:catechol 2,3-dioxygenase-like lactoylglutathione lyase family enzyme
MQKEEKIATNRSPAVFGRGDMGVRHVGLYARDPAATAEFYRDVMGMQIIGGSSADHPFGASAFLTSCPEEEAHELALFANQDFRHFAFRVASLAELRSFYDRVLDRKVNGVDVDILLSAVSELAPSALRQAVGMLRRLLFVSAGNLMTPMLRLTSSR